MGAKSLELEMTQVRGRNVNLIKYAKITMVRAPSIITDDYKELLEIKKCSEEGRDRDSNACSLTYRKRKRKTYHYLCIS